MESGHIVSSIGLALFGLVIIVLAIILYFLPSIVAERRSHNNLTAIVLINAIFGWTVLGWIGALVWAVANPPATGNGQPRGTP